MAETAEPNRREAARRSAGISVSRRRFAPVATLLVGVAITTALSWLTYVLNDHNESRLLDLKARELGTIFTTIVPDVQAPLASASLVASLTDGSAKDFVDEMGPEVGSGRLFVSASLWHRSNDTFSRVTSIGAPADLEAGAESTNAFFRSALRTRTVAVVGLLSGPTPRVGYEFDEPGSQWLVYAESPLPPGRHAAIARTSPFSDVNYALYLGRRPVKRNLLESSVDQLPLTGRTASDTVVFGTSYLTVVLSSIGALGGGLLSNLAWIIAGVGALFALAAALVADRLTRRRAQAEQLAEENLELYREQREQSSSLQHALLPKSLPEIPGIDLAARYLPGVVDTEVGGDWYSAIRLDDERFVFVVGDVSGRGIGAAATMAELRYTIRAYARMEHPPEAILAMAGEELHLSTDGHFATVLVGLVDAARRQLTASSAGHPAPLLIDGDHCEYVDLPVGVPLGLGDNHYGSTTVQIPPRATLVAFTDGLVERRGERIDEGLERLRSAACSKADDVDGLLASLLDELLLPDSEDDVAMLGIQWLT